LESPIKIRNEKLALTVVSALARRGFEACYCEGREETVEKVIGLVPKGVSVSWGGSATIQELKLPDMFHAGGYDVLDRDRTSSPEERAAVMRKALTCDTFITGVNAISEDGQLVNVDALGNRVAAMAFGPRSVVVVASVNKITKTLEDAIKRARTVAAPVNLQRFPKAGVPCLKTGACENCSSSESFCSQLLITRNCRPIGRIKIVLTGEVLGY